MRQATAAQKKLGFRIHTIVFIPSIVLLAMINLLTGAPYWVLWALLGWGVGLLSHWFFVLGPGARKPETT
ncbi:2TM domain-containing protein [Bradyrhizobium oligotrophicum]|uniref:2TM domain-containing protein n=1 Tax=Bradyrhizobium oligotrophicum TaxID=44255 RepID=UPI003EC155F3